MYSLSHFCTAVCGFPTQTGAHLIVLSKGHPPPRGGVRQTGGACCGWVQKKSDAYPFEGPLQCWDATLPSFCLPNPSFFESKWGRAVFKLWSPGVTKWCETLLCKTLYSIVVHHLRNRLSPLREQQRHFKQCNPCNTVQKAWHKSGPWRSHFRRSCGKLITDPKQPQADVIGPRVERFCCALFSA